MKYYFSWEWRYSSAVRYWYVCYCIIHVVGFLGVVRGLATRKVVNPLIFIIVDVWRYSRTDVCRSGLRNWVVLNLSCLRLQLGKGEGWGAGVWVMASRNPSWPSSNLLLLVTTVEHFLLVCASNLLVVDARERVVCNVPTLYCPPLSILYLYGNI